MNHDLHQDEPNDLNGPYGGPTWDEFKKNLLESKEEGLKIGREILKLMGWREGQPLKGNLQSIWAYWTEKVDLDKPSVALHEVGHGLAAFLCDLQVDKIELGESRSRISRMVQLLLYPNSLESGDSIGSTECDITSLEAMEVGAVMLAGFAATSLESPEIERTKRTQATENIDQQHMLEEWTDVTYPYRAVVWEWTRLNQEAPTPKQVLEVIDLWIEELSNVFRQQEPLLRALQQGLLQRPQIYDGKKFIEETIQKNGCQPQDLTRMKSAMAAIRLEELIASVKHI